MTHPSATPVKYLLPLSEQQRSILERAMRADEMLNPSCWDNGTDTGAIDQTAPAYYLRERITSLLQNTGFDKSFSNIRIPSEQEVSELFTEEADKYPVASRLMPLQVIMVHESVTHSALSDLLSVVIYIGCALLGYLANSQMLAAVGMVMTTVAMCFWIGKWRQRYTIEEARDALDKLEANFMEKRRG